MLELRLFADDTPEPARKPRKLPNVLAVHETERLITFARDAIERAVAGKSNKPAAKSKIAAAARDLFLVQFMPQTGLRRAEMCDLLIEHVDLIAQTVHVTHGKGDKERYIPLPDSLVPIVRAWIGARRTGPLVVTEDGNKMDEATLYWRITRLGKYAGFTKKIKPHTLRHTYATRVYELTGDLRLVQALLGHDNISSTQIYTHVAPARLLAAVNRTFSHEKV